MGGCWGAAPHTALALSGPSRQVPPSTAPACGGGSPAPCHAMSLLGGAATPTHTAPRAAAVAHTGSACARQPSSSNPPPVRCAANVSLRRLSAQCTYHTIHTREHTHTSPRALPSRQNCVDGGGGGESSPRGGKQSTWVGGGAPTGAPRRHGPRRKGAAALSVPDEEQGGVVHLLRARTQQAGRAAGRPAGERWREGEECGSRACTAQAQKAACPRRRRRAMLGMYGRVAWEAATATMLHGTHPRSKGQGLGAKGICVCRGE